MTEEKSDQEELKGKLKLIKELNDFMVNPDITDLFGVDYWDLETPDVLHWSVTLYGPIDTFYEGGYFLLKVDFKEDYPVSKPKVHFKTKIYHSNVSQSNGNVCITTLNNWKETIPRPSMKDVFEDIIYLMYNPTPEHGYGNFDDEYLKDISKFEKNAKEWCKIYANVDDYDDPKNHYDEPPDN